MRGLQQPAHGRVCQQSTAWFQYLTDVLRRAQEKFPYMIVTSIVVLGNRDDSVPNPQPSAGRGKAFPRAFHKGGNIIFARIIYYD